jgi:hypothetical protein
MLWRVGVFSGRGVFKKTEIGGGLDSGRMFRTAKVARLADVGAIRSGLAAVRTPSPKKRPSVGLKSASRKSIGSMWFLGL